MTDIQEVLSLNVRWDTDYPDCGVSDVSQLLQANAGIVPQIRP
jgi:hypothetical protein